MEFNEIFMVTVNFNRATQLFQRKSLNDIAKAIGKQPASEKL